MNAAERARLDADELPARREARSVPREGIVKHEDMAANMAAIHNGSACHAHWSTYDEVTRDWLVRTSPLPPWMPPYLPSRSELDDDPLLVRAVELQGRDQRRGIRGLFSTYKALARAEWETGELDVSKLTEAQLMRLYARALREGKRELASELLDADAVPALIRCGLKGDVR